MNSAVAQLLVCIAGALLVAGIPVVGALSDRVGRKPMLTAAAIGFAVLSYPAFWLMSLGAWYTALIGIILLVICHIPILATTTATLPALFATRVRCTGVSIGYNVSFAIFGGTAPLVGTFLTGLTGSSLAPSFYLVAIALAALVAVRLSPETAGTPLPET